MSFFIFTVFLKQNSSHKSIISLMKESYFRNRKAKILMVMNKEVSKKPNFEQLLCTSLVLLQNAAKTAVVKL